ncbi:MULTISPECIES: RcnB family protein [unclassified Acinetobacter]|uniref:RcnB family protein n=1 Tax=unclassified Acinetobacter TaxID=196816 RepID=UPI00244B6F87|nr:MULTISPECIES: RcnB family protein [unclassified Acinetobacter]MDH0032452.1 RcnB family protein [Acinetobacter sp. GD04021]MDH0888017.1 RcnB family protein [Acinetobacter sp. GD03873]MDH1084327.1 RcnB family protein [Acinetobacter sp. GD03983]MDH2191359.1 RcnB family protein [Acinetobacter sp. GD03645]MDH2204897.1 RcnB family protein [Acinetobacter sp. GD03647]
MKKIFIILILGSTTLFSSMGSFAGPHFDRDDSRGGGWQGRNLERDDDPRGNWQGRPGEENRDRERRMRQERGVERLKQHRWQAGYVMPQHYRGNSYKVDYKDNNLPKPGRNEQWYKINNDYILVNSDDNSIVRIMGF